MHNKVEFTQIKSTEQIKELSQMAEVVWREHYLPLIGKEQVDYMMEKFQSLEAMSKQINGDYLYYFLNSNNENVGYIGILPEENALFLSKFYMAKEHRGKGFARETVNFLKEFCLEKKLNKIHLTVNRDNLDSIAVYKKLGFVKVREEKADIGKGYFMDDYIMEMEIGL